MRIILKLLILITSISCSSNSIKKIPCYKYDEKIVLEGKIETRPHPSKNGTYWLLVTAPICTEIPAGEELYEAFANENEIQLVFDLEGKQYNQYRKYLNSQVKVYGDLYGKHTGHHLRNILINVDKIEGQ